MNNLYVIYTDDKKVHNAMHNCTGEKTQTEFRMMKNDFYIAQWFQNNRQNSESVILDRDAARVLVFALQEWLKENDD